MRKQTLAALAWLTAVSAQAQILGGGSTFATAQLFNPIWITNCPGSAQTFSNQAAYEPATAMDACGATPACATGTTGSDVWFSFYAQGATATIVVAPTSSFDVAIQAFSGSSCAGLSEIGCVDANGNNATETLLLTGLVRAQVYYFRIFGAVASVANRTGIYTFCGTTDIGNIVLPVTLQSIHASRQQGKALISWRVNQEIHLDRYVVERGQDGLQFEPVGNVAATSAGAYSFVDSRPLATASYYRLKMLNLDGSVQYSNTALLAKSNSVFVGTATPNPFGDKVEAEFASAGSGLVRLTLSDRNGRIIKRKNVMVTSGTNIMRMDGLQELAAGVYILHAATATETIQFKLVKAR